MRPNRERTSGDGGVDRRGVRDVHLPALGAGRARRLEVGDEGGGLRLVHVPCGHGAAALGEPQGGGAADAGRAARDDRDPHDQNVTFRPTWSSRAGSVAE